MVVEAAAEIARFDSEIGTDLAPFASILLLPRRRSGERRTMARSQSNMSSLKLRSTITCTLAGVPATCRRVLRELGEWDRSGRFLDTLDAHDRSHGVGGHAVPLEMGLWRIDGTEPRRLTTSVLPSEATLEEYLQRDPSLLGVRLLVIGRQVRTPHGKYIDLLAIDGDGHLHLLELKRSKTPRDVVAQVLDYGSWATALTRDSIIEQANSLLDVPFEAAFAEVFDSPPPDELNAELSLTIVATDLDSSSERIVTYLRDFGVPVNVVFFSYLEDDGRRYLGRSWLVANEEHASVGAPAGKKGKQAEWNGRDWYVSFGGWLGRTWKDGRAYNFISAGGDTWYARTLRGLPVGARVNVNVPGRGYVAVGITLAEAARFDEARVQIDDEWVRLADQRLDGSYRHADEGEPETDEIAEYVVPVRWIASRPESEAYWEKGMFANQNSACKLRQEFTLDRLARHFDLGDEDD